MGDGVTNSPEININPEVASKGIPLYESSRFNVFVPAKPNVPLNEGLHVQISDGHDEKDSPKEVLARYTLALGSAKALAESGLTQDAWANTRLEEGQKVSTYGRVPGEEKSWRKPVDTFNRNSSSVEKLEPFYNTGNLQKVFKRYLHGWEALTGKIELFKNGVNGKDINEASREGFNLWENDKFKLEIIANAPHVKGIHLVIHPKESFRRQWQTVIDSDSQPYIEATLEATAVAMGVQKLLAGDRGELHNSGNWAPDLKSKEEGGKFNFKNLSEDKYAEKRLHRPDIAVSDEQINTGMHVHVYAPDEGPVVLPSMSKPEAQIKGRMDIVKQWDEITPISQAKAEEIKAKLGEGKLTKWVEENCKGKL